MNDHRRDDNDDHALDDPKIIASEIEALVAFFHALSPEARGEYDALAELDRLWGEDVEAQHRAQDQLDHESSTKR